MATNWPTSRDTFTNPTSGDTLDSPSHAAQHANINDAVEAMQLYAGLVLVKTQTIGTAVASVTVSNAFSSTFDNYRVSISGQSGNTGAWIQLTFVGTTGATNYYSALYLDNWTTQSVRRVNGGAFSEIGQNAGGPYFSAMFDVFRPLAGNEYFNWAGHGGDGANFHSFGGSYLKTGDTVTGFTITPSTGTLTGGTIRVYGYNNG